MKALLPALLFCAVGASAQVADVGCTPATAETVGADEFKRDYEPLTKGAGAEVPKLAGEPGAAWDLGEKRTARMSVYLTRNCELGMSVSVVSGGRTSSPNPQSAVETLAALLKTDAPDWAFSVEPPSTIKLKKNETAYSTDLRKLLQLRLDAATKIELGGAQVRAIYDGFLLFIVPEDAGKSVNLSVRSTVYPWAVYDLTAYGLPRLLVHFDENKARLIPLP